LSRKHNHGLIQKFNDAPYLVGFKFIYEITYKRTVQPGRHTSKYGARALHAAYLKLQIYIQIM